MNEELKNKLSLMLINTKEMSVTDAIQYIKSIFPKEEFEYETREHSNDFFIEDKEIIHLSPRNVSKIIFSYPEGDIFGDRLSDPYNDISIEIFQNNQLIQYPLFENNHVKDKWYDDIYRIMDEIVKDCIISKEFAISYLKENLDKYPPQLPVSFIEKLNNDLLSDSDIKMTVIDSMKQIASYEAGNAYDQYMYGRYGGEDIKNWEMSEGQQFKHIAFNLPDNILEIYKDDFQDAYLQYDDTKKMLINSLKYLNSELNTLSILEENKDLICNYLFDRNQVAMKYFNFFDNFQKEYSKILHSAFKTDLYSGNYYEHEFIIYRITNRIFLNECDLNEIDKEIAYYQQSINDNVKIMEEYEQSLKHDDCSLEDSEQIKNKINMIDNQIDDNLEKYNTLAKKEYSILQVIQKRANENELKNISKEIMYDQELLIYLKSKMDNISFHKKISDLESIISEIKMYNEDVKLLNSKYGFSPLKDILTTLSSREDLAKQLIADANDYKSVIKPISYITPIENEIRHLEKTRHELNDVEKQIQRFNELRNEKDDTIVETKDTVEHQNTEVQEPEEDEGLEI